MHMYLFQHWGGWGGAIYDFELHMFVYFMYLSDCFVASVGGDKIVAADNIISI